MVSVMNPPSVGPTIGPKMTPTPNSAIALPCSCRGNDSSRIACDIGTMAPPARPCSTRIAISMGSDTAAPEPIDASVNSTRQVRYDRLRPK